MKMILAIINIVLVVWIYFYLIELKRMNCKCAFTPHYYFIVLYILISLVYIFLSSYIGYINVTFFIVLSFVYFIFTVTFVFSTFSYIRYIESTDCDCADTFDSNILTILAWLRIISFAMILIALIIILYSKNTISDLLESPIANSKITNSRIKNSPAKYSHIKK